MADRKRKSETPSSSSETKKNMREFGVFDERTSDAVLIAGGRKFYVSKHHLAAHSDFFKSMFFSPFNESTKNEIELEGVDPEELQKFLETINGEICIDDKCVDGVLRLADMWLAETAKNACENFLLRDSNKCNKELFSIARGYNLENLKIDVISRAESISELNLMLPTDVMTMDHSTMGEVLKKFSSLNSRPISPPQAPHYVCNQFPVNIPTHPVHPFVPHDPRLAQRHGPLAHDDPRNPFFQHLQALAQNYIQGAARNADRAAAPNAQQN